MKLIYYKKFILFISFTMILSLYALLNSMLSLLIQGISKTSF